MSKKEVALITGGGTGIGLAVAKKLHSMNKIVVLTGRRKEKLLSYELAKKSPILMRQLTDPTFAALAYDNINDLEGLEYAFDAIKKAPEEEK